MSQTIAFFDFDGTVTYRDSLLEFIKYTKGVRAFYTGFIVNTPLLFAYKLKMISNQCAKERMLRYFFGRMPLEKFNNYCISFSKEIMPSLIRPKALEEIQKLKEKGAVVVIVSASPENWLKYWCENLFLQLIGTKLKVTNNLITGDLDGSNCYGKEKVIRIKENYDLNTFSSVYCYGDTPGDKPMLALGTISFYKPFR